jgi:predicted metal-dependent phosphoesterase TrpH
LINGDRPSDRTVPDSALRHVFDLHVHTTEGSQDSSLKPEDLVNDARRRGIGGALLAEHDGWRNRDFHAFAAESDVVLVHALEVYTDMGHVITLGLRAFEPGMQHLATLRRIVNDCGGFMILAHPFRFLFDPHGLVTRNILFPDPDCLPKTPADALAHPAFALVDEVEVVNAANNDRENRFAAQVARLRGKPGVAGSDAHSVHGLARGATLMHGDIRSERDLLDALRAGAYSPVERSSEGRFFLA